MGRGYVSDVASLVTAYDAAQRYGLRIEHNKAHCIHGRRDTNASMSFRPRDGLCTCWACGGKGVSSVDIAMYQLNIASPTDAARQIDIDFGLNLWRQGTDGHKVAYKPVERPIQPWEMRQRIKERLSDLNRDKAILEGEFESSGMVEPTEEWFAHMDALLQERSKFEEFLMNVDAGEVNTD